MIYITDKIRFFISKLTFGIVFYFGILLNPLVVKASNDSIKKIGICQELTIKSAQLANQSYEFSKKSYFEQPVNFYHNIDTALYYIKESIYHLDSVLLIAPDSNTTGIKLANTARTFALNSYHTLAEIKNNASTKYALSKKAMYYASNATVDSYHSSLYFIDHKKVIEKKDSMPHEKIITKLDIDQSLFTILKEDLNEKKQANTAQIAKLAKEITTTTDKAKKTKLEAALAEQELKKKDLDKKDTDAGQKLNTINLLLDEQTKSASKKPLQKDTVYTKRSIKVTDEWNNQIKKDSELPDHLIYQIQLGVFKSAVLKENFKGLTPIYSKVTEKGTSYSIGLFEKFSDATEAKNNIKSMGIVDAFIVAYYNKKKITIAEAAKLEKK